MYHSKYNKKLFSVAILFSQVLCSRVRQGLFQVEHLRLSTCVDSLTYSEMLDLAEMSVGQMAFDRMTWSHRKVLVGGQHSTASKSHLLKNVFIITKDPLLTSYVIIS